MNENIVIKVCPMCGEQYVGAPAISRRDNKTEICPECGISEALEDFLASMWKSEQEVKV